MKIEIDMNDLGIRFDEDGEPTGLREGIIRQVAHLLTTEGGAFYDLKSQVRTQLNDLIAEKVGKLVQDAIDAPVQRTTRWGEPQGEPTTVRELIREEIKRYMNAPAGNNGYNSKPGNLAELIRQEAVITLNREMTAEVKKIREDIKGTTISQITETVAREFAK